MRSLTVAVLLLVTPAVSAAPKAAAKHETKAIASKGATGVTDATVTASVTEFVDALNSLEDERVLGALSPSDRISLRGHQNLIGTVFGKKMLNPQVKKFDKIEKDGKLLGAKAVVSVDEVDPIEGTKASKEHTWFLALDEKNTLKVSLTSIWLDTGKIGAGE